MPIVKNQLALNLDEDELRMRPVIRNSTILYKEKPGVAFYSFSCRGRIHFRILAENFWHDRSRRNRIGIEKFSRRNRTTRLTDAEAVADP